MNDTVPTHEMIQNLAEYIVNGMSYQELTQHVYEDVYSIMSEQFLDAVWQIVYEDVYSTMLDDQEVFHANLESLGFEPEDFTNKKFRGEDAV